MCLNTRGLVRSVIRRMVPPLPAESRPSNTMQTLAPAALTHSCMATNSPCRRRISFSYSFLVICGLAAGAASPSPAPGVGILTCDSVDVSAFLVFFDFLPIRRSPFPNVTLVLAPCPHSASVRGDLQQRAYNRLPR